ncbi:MAG: hypothetical protein AAF264_10145 [Pseudomonadota bacterium]
MIRAGLALACCLVGPVLAQETTPGPRVQSVAEARAGDQSYHRSYSASLCDATDLEIVAAAPWQTLNFLEVVALSRILSDVDSTADPEAPGDYAFSPPDDAGAMSRQAVRGSIHMDDVRPVAHRDLDLDYEFDRGMSLRWLLGDYAFQRIAGCDADRLPIVEIDGSVSPVMDVARTGYIVFLTADLGYVISGYDPKTGNRADRSFTTGILMR